MLKRKTKKNKIANVELKSKVIQIKKQLKQLPIKELMDIADYVSAQYMERMDNES